MGSMIVIVIFLSVAFFGLVYSLFGYSINPVIESFNGLVDGGYLTEQTAHTFNISTGLWNMLPFFFIVGLVLWSYERAKNPELSAYTFFGYLTLMLVGAYVTIMLVFSLGLPMDTITMGLEGTTLTDVGPEWDVSGPRGIILSGFYYILLLIGYVSSLLYMIHPVLKQLMRHESFSGAGSDTEESFESSNDVTLEQY